jgi:hypothetical protein
MVAPGSETDKRLREQNHCPSTKSRRCEWHDSIAEGTANVCLQDEAENGPGRVDYWINNEGIGQPVLPIWVLSPEHVERYGQNQRDGDVPRGGHC